MISQSPKGWYFKSLLNPGNEIETLKKLVRISSAVVRLTIGIGGAMLIFFALKNNSEQGRSKKSVVKEMH